MKRSIEWQNTRNANYIYIHKRISNVSPRIVSKLGYNESNRVIIGFSDDRQLLYIKKQDNGLKLSVIHKNCYGRTFSSIALIKNFGDIIGTYEYDSVDDGIVVLRKVWGGRVNDKRWINRHSW